MSIDPDALPGGCHPLWRGYGLEDRISDQHLRSIGIPVVRGTGDELPEQLLTMAFDPRPRFRPLDAPFSATLTFAQMVLTIQRFADPAQQRWWWVLTDSAGRHIGPRVGATWPYPRYS